MEKFKILKCLAILMVIGLSVVGCATQDANPPRAHGNTGYVDFHAVSPGDLCWGVARFDDRKQHFQSVFSELKPPSKGILRLAFAPGHYRFRITFLNRVIRTPAEIDVKIQDGYITPVQVTMTATGAALVETREYSRGGTAKGRYGRRTTLGSDETAMYDLSAVADAPVAYQIKEHMPYAR